MNRKLLIRIIVVFVIAAAIWAPALFLPLFLAVWIYLVWMVWKKKTKIFHDQMEPKLAERRLKKLKAFLRVAGIGFAMFWAAFILQGVLMKIFGQPEEEGPVVFFIALFSAGVFNIATIGGLIIFLKGRRETT